MKKLQFSALDFIFLPRTPLLQNVILFEPRPCCVRRQTHIIMPAIGDVLLKRWYRMLALPRQSPSWYRDRVREELYERRNATTPWQRFCETSDVFFSSSRAKYEGCQVVKLPPPATTAHIPIYVYMMVKFTSRFMFYRTVCLLCNISHRRSVREVINPHKDSKLDQVSSRHHIDVAKFRRVGRRLRRVWPLLP